MVESEKRQRWLEQLANYIVESTKNTWAANKGEVLPTFPGGKRYFHRSEDGLWEFHDESVGYFSLSGLRVIEFKKKEAWAMTYSGRGMFPGHEGEAKETFTFLKKALMHVEPDFPYRGQKFYQDGEWEYNFGLREGSDLTQFSGSELISRRRKLIFEQVIGGNVIRHRGPDGKPLMPWDF